MQLFFGSATLTDKMPVNWNQLHPNHLTDKIVCQIFSELALNFELRALLWAFDKHFVGQTPELWDLFSELWTLSYEYLTGILSVKWAELWALNSELWARTWALNYAQNLMGYIHMFSYWFLIYFRVFRFFFGLFFPEFYVYKNVKHHILNPWNIPENNPKTPPKHP